MDRTDLKWERKDDWIVSPSGAKLAKVVDGNIELYDKKAKVGIPFTIEDFKKATNVNNIGTDT